MFVCFEIKVNLSDRSHLAEEESRSNFAACIHVHEVISFRGTAPQLVSSVDLVGVKHLPNIISVLISQQQRILWVSRPPSAVNGIC